MAPDKADGFTLSLDDLSDKAQSSGWTFWRGFAVGVLATAAVTMAPALIL